MSDSAPHPTAEDIERTFDHPLVKGTRPIAQGGLMLLQWALQFGWTCEGLGRLRAIDGPFILAANHTSHADTQAILSVLPSRLRNRTCVAAAQDTFGAASEIHSLKDIQKTAVEFAVASAFRAFAFDRRGSPLRSLRTAIELVDHGWNLLIYPEGTRSRTGMPGEFKPGIGLLAKKTGVPVVPVRVTGSNEILPPGSTVPRPETAHVAFGAPLKLEDGEDTREFPGRLREAVLSLRTEPRPRPDRFRILARHVYRSVAQRISEFDS